MAEMLEIYLATFDNISEDFTRIEEYMTYRIGNCGY